jgi:hypothetical protein
MGTAEPGQTLSTAQGIAGEIAMNIRVDLCAIRGKNLTLAKPAASLEGSISRRWFERLPRRVEVAELTPRQGCSRLSRLRPRWPRFRRLAGPTSKRRAARPWEQEMQGGAPGPSISQTFSDEQPMANCPIARPTDAGDDALKKQREISGCHPTEAQPSREHVFAAGSVS